MKHFLRVLCLTCAITMLAVAGGALADDMPIVTDEPLSEEEVSLAEAERMREAQQMLIDLGCLDGAADGEYGPKTAAALKLFQARNSLMQTGALNDATLEALRRQARAAGEAKETQQRLIDLGYLRGKADGIFGERSQEALKLFQAMAELDVTGAMDDATRAALFSDDARALPARLTGGDKGDAVTALQERLIQLGFLTGKADGSYGKATASAVRQFQNHLLAQGVDENLGIAANGEATPATQALLFDPEYSTYISDIAAGDEGGEVLRVERRLVQLGYMDMPANETFDAYATSAAAAFRVDAGLAASDAVDKATIDALFAADVPQAARFVPHDIAKGDKGLAVREVENALLRSGMMIKVPNGKFDDLLEEAIERLYAYLSASGDAGAAFFADPAALSVEAQSFLVTDWPAMPVDGDDEATIQRLQRRLHTLYYLPKSAVDGKVGEKTSAALREFQSTNGLEDTGKADAATRQAIFSESAVCKQLPYRVEVSLDDQRVYVYERSEAGDYELIHTFICSTGLGNSTPRGIFLDGFPVNYWHYFKKFDCWAKYSFEIEGDIMFHSVIFSKDDDSTLRESSLYALGQKASHGCIRLKVADARWLYQNCKRGSLAIVIY
ncbi:MAG: peptidoglycan-binding protein [Clostridia bacterium]|nr:peptidoglycan-binding protein [Clostridia bacterium]